MAGKPGASMAGLESDGTCDSENRNKRIKSEDGVDRFSALPDFLIHRILSLLPATDLVKTLVLSKSWKYQWTHVPVLKFVPNDGTSPDKFSNFIDKTLILNDCSNIDKFVINLESFSVAEHFINLNSWIDFAVRKDVKELIVNYNRIHSYWVPQLVFENSSLVKLKLSDCDLMHNEKVNWKCIKSLCLYSCELGKGAIENVLTGSPLLEYLELCSCDFNWFGTFAIASKNLKTLIVDGLGGMCRAIEISCPNLARLRISGRVWFTSLKLVNLPSSVYATLDFYFGSNHEDMDDNDDDDCVNLVQQTLRQVQHVEKLEIGRWMLEILSYLEDDGDYIGGLPYSFIHRIISYIPLTKDAFESDSYETLQRKWTDVPILNFVDKEKFVIDSKDIPLVNLDPRLTLWIRFAARKDVKELILDCVCTNVKSGDGYLLPQFLFNNSSLVKMKICSSDFMLNGKVNWESLKSLHLEHCELGNQAIEHILSGSPLLECLILYCCGYGGELVVASQHLETFLLDGFCKSCHLIEISCANLKSLILSGSVGSTRLKFTNLPSSLHATLDFYILQTDNISPDDWMIFVDETAKQIMHVEELGIGLKRLRS